MRISSLLAAAGFLVAVGVGLYEVRWIGRAALAWPLICICIAICLVAAGVLARDPHWPE